MANVVSRALNQASPGEPLQKLRLDCEQGDGSYDEEETVMFNPNSIRRSRRIKYRDRPGWVTHDGWTWLDSRKNFILVHPEKLSLTLFFDTYERHSGSHSLTQQARDALQTANPFARGSSSDVQVETRKVMRLAEVDVDLHRPPGCVLNWGENGDMFWGVLTHVVQKFTMFLPNGLPVRATLDCEFSESETQAHARAQEVHSADVIKSHVVKRGDTLHGLAAAEYGDPALWRNIARANGIVNPRSLHPGTVLIIPKLAR